MRERVVSLAGRRTGGEQLSRGGLSHEDGRSRESNNGEDGGTEVGRPQAASCTHCKANVTASVSASLSPGSRPAGRSDTAVGSEPVASAAVMSAPVDVTAQLHAAMEELSDRVRWEADRLASIALAFFAIQDWSMTKRLQHWSLRHCFTWYWLLW